VAWAVGYLHTKRHLDPSSHLATVDMGQKLGALPPFWEWGAGSPSNTMSLGLRPTFLPSGILIHQPFGHNRYGPKIGGFPFGGGELDPHLTQCGWGRGLPACQVSSWSIRPFVHNTPTLQTDRHDRTDQTDRQTDSGPIG